MNINDILKYVMNTPHNTNRIVLKGMLDSLVSDTTSAADADDPVAEAISISENGVTNAPEGTVYNKVTVAVPEPSGSLEISENGTYDVTSKASAVVNVSSGSSDFSTVEVTFVNTTTQFIDVYVPTAVYETEDTLFPERYYNVYGANTEVLCRFEPNLSTTVDVILYKGTAVARVSYLNEGDDPGINDVTEGIEIADNGYAAVITRAGTITLAGPATLTA